MTDVTRTDTSHFSTIREVAPGFYFSIQIAGEILQRPVLDERSGFKRELRNTALGLSLDQFLERRRQVCLRHGLRGMPLYVGQIIGQSRAAFVVSGKYKPPEVCLAQFRGPTVLQVAEIEGVADLFLLAGCVRKQLHATLDGKGRI